MSVSVVDVLAGQHRRMAELFELVASPDEDRPARLRELLRELAAHVAAERQLTSDMDDPKLAEEYRAMEELMVRIERRKFNSPDVPDLVTELKGRSEAHTRDTEARVFPALEDRSWDEQVELGRKVSEEEADLATHPHPHLNSNKVVSSTLGRAVAKWDSARDKTVNNRHLEDSPGQT